MPSQTRTTAAIMSASTPDSLTYRIRLAIARSTDDTCCIAAFARDRVTQWVGSLLRS